MVFHSPQFRFSTAGRVLKIVSVQYFQIFFFVPIVSLVCAHVLLQSAWQGNTCRHAVESRVQCVRRKQCKDLPSKKLLYYFSASRLPITCFVLACFIEPVSSSCYLPFVSMICPWAHSWFRILTARPCSQMECSFLSYRIFYYVPCSTFSLTLSLTAVSFFCNNKSVQDPWFRILACR